MTKKQRFSSWIVLSLILSMLLAACGGPAATSTPGNADGGTGAAPTVDEAAGAGVTATAPIAGEAGETATAPVVEETETAPMAGVTATTGGAVGATETTAPTTGGPVGMIPANLQGKVVIEGSSTVQPITQAAAEDFSKQARGVQITVGGEGTGTGFTALCEGTADIADASRPIKPEEVTACEEGGVEFIEVPVAVDGITVVANNQNNWAKCLTTQELKTLFDDDNEEKVTTWNQVRKAFPNTPLSFYVPGQDSGTREFFAEEIVPAEAEGAEYPDDFDIRADEVVTESEQDNALVEGVSRDEGAVGFFGYAYYQANKNRLEAIAVDSGAGCVQPSPQTIANGKYVPLSRPLFMYVKKEAAARPEVKAYVNYVLSQKFVPEISSDEIGYVTLSPQLYQGIRQRFAQQTTGTLFGEGSPEGNDLSRFLEK